MRLIDFMPPRGENPDIVRIVEGVSGKVAIADGVDHPVRLRPRRSVGAETDHGGLEAIAGPDALDLAYAGRDATAKT